MKRIIAFLLAILMCLSMVACSEQESDSSGKKNEKDKNNKSTGDFNIMDIFGTEPENIPTTFLTAEEFVGKWCSLDVFYGADGRVESARLAFLDLLEDGKCEYYTRDLDSGLYSETEVTRWEYSEKSDDIIIDLSTGETSYDIYRSKDGKDASLGQGYVYDEENNGYWSEYEVEFGFYNTFYRENTGCTEFSSGFAGNYISSYGSGIVTVTEEGNIVTSEWNMSLVGIPCYGPFHMKYIAEIGVIRCDTVNGKLEINGGSIYTKTDGEITHFTVNDWTSYFSGDFFETFDASYSVNVSKNTWGEYSGASLSVEYKIKEFEKYGDGTQIDVEYSYVWSSGVMTYNTVTNEIVALDITPYEYSEPDIGTSTVSYESSEYFENDGVLDANRLYVAHSELVSVDGDIANISFNIYYPPSITRMQGTLITQ